MKATLAAVIHGEAGTGKSYFAGTTPAPRLILDCEGGSRFVPMNLPFIPWNPKTEPVPEYDGSWNAVIVSVQDWETLIAAYNVVASGAHPFKSVILDSLTEAQKRLMDNVAGVEQPTMQQWGEVLRYLEDLVRRFRDLTFHPTHPVEAVVMTCLSHFRDEHTRPFLKGQLELSLPSFTDMVGYCYTDQNGATGGMDYRMLIAPANNIIAKDRPGVMTRKEGPVLTNTNFTTWLAEIQSFYDEMNNPTPATTSEEN